MPNKSLTIQVPGKLMVAGEFAVLEPNQQLAVMAVNRFVYVDIHASEGNFISLEKFHLHELKWNYVNEEAVIESEDNRVNFVQEALTIACRYLQEKGIPFQHVTLTIRSELDDKETGKKFGLGSSAAVVVGVITAVLAYHNQQEPEPKLIFQLAAISHVKAQGNGSGADVAASSYGGILQYTSFQAEWLRERFHQASSLQELLNMEWSYWTAKPIRIPDNAHICIGWTGSPASTGNLVNQILSLKTSNPAKFEHFLHKSQEAVQNFLKGLEHGNQSLLFKGIKQNRNALVTVGKEAKTELETSMIKKLCDLAEEFGGAAKQSGAGGGDCGIAFMPTNESANKLMEAWREVGITPLDIQPYPNGAMVEK